jgi:hypothetical protein
MSRTVIEKALVDGDSKAFELISQDYIAWLSQQNLEVAVNRYFADPELLALEFYLWIIESKKAVA